MVVYGCRPQNMKLLVKTSLINGQYRIAENYIRILKNTIYYRNWAKEYEKMVGDTSIIRSHPELENKIKILPRDDFFIFLESPQNNLPSLLEVNPANKSF
jgi:hypothetical protein